MPDADAARARFAAATTAHLTAPLADDIELRACTHAELIAANDTLWVESRGRARLEPLYRPEEGERIADLNACLGEPMAHRLLLVRRGELVGAFFAEQQTIAHYHMVTSVVHPDLRGRGIYSQMLARLIAAARDSGFQEIRSRHRVDNNAILVPKLKAGFTIGGFEITPRWGLLVYLRMYLLEALERAHRYRVDGTHGAELRALGVID